MQTTKDQLLQEVVLAKSNGNFAQALENTQALIDRDSRNHEAYIMQGDLYLELGNYHNAERSYQRALAIRPGLADVYYKLGACMEASDNNKAALDQYQTALNLSPENTIYQGKLGVLIYKVGLDKNNINYMSEGIMLMEGCLAAGEAPGALRDSLAHAYLERAISSWVADPEVPGQVLATNYDQLATGEKELAAARELLGPENIALNERANDLEQQLTQLKKKRYYGIKKYLKVPIVFGFIFLFFGAGGQSILSFIMAGLYYLSNRKPGYIQNNLYVQNKMSNPIALRIIDQMNNTLSQFSIFGSFSNVLFTTTLIRFFTRLLGACFVMITLPYEIVKNFITNYSYQEVTDQLQGIKSALVQQKEF